MFVFVFVFRLFKVCAITKTYITEYVIVIKYFISFLCRQWRNLVSHRSIEREIEGERERADDRSRLGPCIYMSYVYTRCSEFGVIVVGTNSLSSLPSFF